MRLTNNQRFFQINSLLLKKKLKIIFIFGKKQQQQVKQPFTIRKSMEWGFCLHSINKSHGKPRGL